MPYGKGSIKQATAADPRNSTALVPVKVMDIIMDIDHPLAERHSYWDSLGMIFYYKLSELYENPELESSIQRNEKGQILSSMDKAKPLFANSKYYPLKGEIVIALSSTGKEGGGETDKYQTYYLPNINIWNHPHHNALPNPNVYETEGGQNDYKKYENALGGLVRHVTDGKTDITLGGYFREQMNIKLLLPFEGDHILEGRFGNSIRFGATSRDKEGNILGLNNWSEAGQIGDPITIIRNGQAEGLDTKGWEPTTEDVNRDPSSIYLTSTQKLDNFNPASTNWQSWGAEPTIVEDPIEALTSPPAATNTVNEEVAAEEAWGGGDENETVETEEKKLNQEDIIEEEDTTTSPKKTEDKDELSLYDELIESGDYDEDDFEEFDDFEMESGYEGGLTGQEYDLTGDWSGVGGSGIAIGTQITGGELLAGPKGGLVNPLDQIRVTSTWGAERTTSKGKPIRHPGMDLGASKQGVSGDKVFAPADGYIREAKFSSGACGGTIKIKHAGGIRTRYCHLKGFVYNGVVVEPKDLEGQNVKQGDVIAIMGGDKNDKGRGSSRATHLHYEVYDNDPMPTWWTTNSKGKRIKKTGTSNPASYLT